MGLGVFYLALVICLLGFRDIGFKVQGLRVLLPGSGDFSFKGLGI